MAEDMYFYLHFSSCLETEDSECHHTSMKDTVSLVEQRLRNYGY